MTLTKADLTERVHQADLGLTRKEAFEAVEATFEILKATLAAGEVVLITGFGRFTVRQKAARVGRNPKTGGELVIAGRRVVGFKYSVGLKDAVNAAARPARRRGCGQVKPRRGAVGSKGRRP